MSSGPTGSDVTLDSCRLDRKLFFFFFFSVGEASGGSSEGLNGELEKLRCVSVETAINNNK